MTRAATSLVIVSRDRPAQLHLCLTACARLIHPRLELIVVADPAGLAAARAHPLAPALKSEPFDTANISAARDRGIARAAGDIVAFTDDDAVPEPLWLWHLTAAFADPRVAAATGFTRNPGGMRLQSGAAWIRPDGRTIPFDLTGDRPVLVTPPPGHGVKTEGANMAFRRAVLERLGGFDESYPFYLDDADMNLRLARAGMRTAIVPKAQVIHGHAAGPRRSSEGVAQDLTDVGRSLALFARRHGADPAAALTAERTARRNRLLRAMVAGMIQPGDVTRILAGFDAGARDGLTAKPQAATTIAPATHDFRPLPARAYRPQIIAGRLWNRRHLRSEAARAATRGGPVTLILLSRTAIFHRERFTPDGYWEQRGGLYGRSRRTDPLFRIWRFARRVQREIARFVPFRGTAQPAMLEIDAESRYQCLR